MRGRYTQQLLYITQSSTFKIIFPLGKLETEKNLIHLNT